MPLCGHSITCYGCFSSESTTTNLQHLSLDREMSSNSHCTIDITKDSSNSCVNASYHSSKSSNVEEVGSTFTFNESVISVENNEDSNKNSNALAPACAKTKSSKCSMVTNACKSLLNSFSILVAAASASTSNFNRNSKRSKKTKLLPISLENKKIHFENELIPLELGYVDNDSTWGNNFVFDEEYAILLHSQ